MDENRIEMIEQMEAEIVRERQEQEKEGRRSFSYILYANKIKKYKQNRDRFATDAYVRKRLEEIIVQYQINMEDHSSDGELCMHYIEKMQKINRELAKLTD